MHATLAPPSCFAPRLRSALSPDVSRRSLIRPPPCFALQDTLAAQADLQATLDAKGLKELPGALIDTCKPGAPVQLAERADAAPVTNGNIKVASSADGALTVTAVDTGKTLFTTKTTFSATSHLVPAGFKAIDFSMTAGDKDERIYGLGQVRVTFALAFRSLFSLTVLAHVLLEMWRKSRATGPVWRGARAACRRSWCRSSATARRSSSSSASST